MESHSLAPAVATYQSSKDIAALLLALKTHFKIEHIAEAIIPYLEGKEETAGYYMIQEFERCYDEHYTYQKLFHRFGEDFFPAICFGGDGEGVEFHLLLETGQVITLHHDATFYEVAGYIKAESGPEFTRKFATQGSLFSLPQLLHLQALTRELDEQDDNFGKGLMKAAASALGISLRDTAAYFSDSRFSFVYTQLGDLYDFEEELEEFLAEEEGE